MKVTQASFRAAILDAGRPAPEGLADPEGRPAGRRFDVYRNNVAVSLTEALETAFPVVRKIVGEAFFAAMAGVYLREHPPRSPLLMFYGDEMPGFLARFGPARSLGYLPDVARLELALHSAYHAADVAKVGPGDIEGTRLFERPLRFAPAVRLIRSRWPLHGIWRANTDPEARRTPEMRKEDVLVVRPAFDPEVILLAPPDATFVAALLRGQTMTAALLEAGESFDPTPAMTALLRGGAITGSGDPPS